MPSQQNFEAKEILLKVDVEVRNAIALREMYIRCECEDVIDAYNNTPEHYGFRSIQISLMYMLIAVLARIFDISKDAASLFTIHGLLKDMRVGGASDFSIEIKELSRLKGDHRIAGLREIRNQILAHLDINDYRHHSFTMAEHGEPLVDDAKQIVERLHLKLRNHSADFDTPTNYWRQYADDFWRKAIDNASDEPVLK